MGRDEILDAMAYLGYQVRDEQGEITPRAWATAAALVGLVQPNNFMSQQVAGEWLKREAFDHECEFCGDNATHTETFDKPVYVCDACHVPAITS